MRILSRAIFREVLISASLGTLLFIFVLFLRTIERLSALLVKVSAPPAVVARLFLYALPSTIPFALPLGVLVGILIGLSRMSADSEIVAMRASGISSKSVARPVLLFAMLALVLTALASLWLTPLSLHLESKTARNFAAAQLTGAIESRIFDEQFPNTVLYVGNVSTALNKQIVWRQVFIADVTPPDQLREQGKDRGEGPRIIVAQEAIPHADPANNRVILDMRGVHTTERDKEGKVITTSASTQIQTLQAQKQEELQLNKTVQEMDTGPLYKRVYRQRGLSHDEYVEAAIELHQRFSLPLGCVLLALVGIPLGISSRKGGKAAAFILTVTVAFLYDLGYIALIGLARKGSLPVPVAVWTPDVTFSIIGLFLMSRLELPGDRDAVALVHGLAQRILARLKSLRLAPDTLGVRLAMPSPLRRFRLRPMLIDRYVLNGFLFYFVMLVSALLVLIEVFTFFELLGDMMKNGIAMSTMLDYLYHLAPSLIYQLTPIGTLVASLICFGILTKYNEVTAFKAGGISVHRLAAPVLCASLALSVLIFAFDHYYIPQANRRQEMLRAIIKNKPVATYLRTGKDRHWIYGQGSRIYNYQFMDPRQAVMSKVNVYELNPATFEIVRQISADKAQWNSRAHTWVLHNGMSHDMFRSDSYKPFFGCSASFPELTEPPAWFAREEKEYKEMNFEELSEYIRELQTSGNNTTPLRVEYYKKFAVPLFAFIMAVLSVPFAFIAGNRGAMAGVGISFGIAIAYWTIGTLFQQIGELNQLPAAMAAWSPDILFALFGFYFMARMKT